MLARLDKVLALLAWLAAAAVVVMLVAGPAVIAEDKENPPKSEAAGAAAYSAGAAAGGEPKAKAVFAGNCGSCHTLRKAGTTGAVGPPLDDVSLDTAAIEQIVRKGRGGMPAFDGQLSPDEIRAVAAYVAGSR